MLRAALADLRASRGRLVATLVAVVLGVGFVGGTMVYGDTLKVSLFDGLARAARNVDVAVLPSGAAGSPASLPAGLLDDVRATAGVAGAEGRYSVRLPLLDRDGDLLGDGDQPGFAISAGTDPLLRPYDLVSGRFPAGRGEALVDEKTASRAGFAPGETVTVFDIEHQRRPLIVVGTFSISEPAYSGFSVLALAEVDLVALVRPAGYSEIVVRAARGVDPGTLAARIASVAPHGAAVATGEQRRVDLANRVVRDVDLLMLGLSVFSLVAFLVAAFVIFNTFTVLVAQRARSFGLLRCVGASRAQVFGSVLLEAAAVGLAGGALGILAGLAVAYGLFVAFSWAGITAALRPPVLTPLPLVVAVVGGVAITLVSAVVPAVRATRVAPLEALRADPEARTKSVRGRVVRLVLALLVALPGAVASGTGAFLPSASVRMGSRAGEWLVIGGGVLVFLGLLIATPVFIGPLCRLIGALPARVGGPPVRLAVANARRSPGRAAVTAATLMVGVGLMTVFSVTLASSSSTFGAALRNELPVDYGLSAVEFGVDVGVPARVVAALRARPEFDGVAEVRSTNAEVDGRTTTLSVVDRAGLDVLRLQATAGDLADLGPGTVVLTDDESSRRGKPVGSSVTITYADQSMSLEVAATVANSPGTGAVLLDPAEYADRFGTGDPQTVYLRAAPGWSPERSRAAVEAVIADEPLITVSSVAELRDELTSQINNVLGLFAGLLGISLLIALVGIANTVSLSVVERATESAVLRALGFTRGQLRASLLSEALLMAAVGSLVGMVFGIVYGVLLARATFAVADLVVAIPVGQLLAYVGLAAVAGAVAAILPARRAARASITSAMAAT